MTRLSGKTNGMMFSLKVGVAMRLTKSGERSHISEETESSSYREE